MSGGADIRDIDALGSLKNGFGRFGEEVLRILPSIQKQLEDTEAWLEDRHQQWQRHVEAAENELNAAKRSLNTCEDTGYYDEEGDYQAPDCSVEEEQVTEAERHLTECEANLETVKRWRHRIESQIADFQNDIHRLSQLASTRTASAQVFLAGKIQSLGRYVGGTSSTSGDLHVYARDDTIAVPIFSRSSVDKVPEIPLGSKSTRVGNGTEQVYFCARIRNQRLANQRHPETNIPFDRYGFPNFSSVAINKVKITVSGNRRRDHREANEKAGIIKEPRGYIWHHCEDGTTMQLVFREIHEKTGHTGGAAGQDALYTYKYQQ